MADSTEATTPLASDFPDVSEADWLALVRKSAPERAVRDLAAASDDGIVVGPIYGSDRSGEIVAPASPGGWRITQRIDHKEVAAAARQIAEDVAGGATAIELVFASSPWAHGAGLAAGLDQLAALLRQNAVAIRVDAGEETPALTVQLIRLLQADGEVRQPVTAAIDLYATMAAQGGLRRRHDELVTAIVDLLAELERSGVSGSAFVADGRLWHAGGASEAQELAATIAAYVAALRLFEDHGIDLRRGAARIGVGLAADADQFMTIAKFRAARLLVGRILESADIDSEAPLMLHAETAWRMLSRNDAHTNIVRANSAALAAGLGGADSLTVLPFDSTLHLPDRLARRVARNSQTILLREASLALVADPGAGAGAVEALTDRLAEKAWAHFQAIEAEGGLPASLRAGTLQRAIAEMREKRLHRVLRRGLPLTGVTSYPAITTAAEASPAVLDQGPAAAPPLSETIEALVVTRLAEPFEALRERADGLALSGKRPAVFLAMLGRPSETAALASEVRQLFASGGLAAVTGAPIAPEAAGAAFAESRAEATCICATAKSGEAEIAAAARALKAGGAMAIGLAGHAGAVPFRFDYLIERDTDVVALLSAILERIAIGRKAAP